MNWIEILLDCSFSIVWGIFLSSSSMDRTMDAYGRKQVCQVLTLHSFSKGVIIFRLSVDTCLHRNISKIVFKLKRFFCCCWKTAMNSISTLSNYRNISWVLHFLRAKLIYLFPIKHSQIITNKANCFKIIFTMDFLSLFTNAFHPSYYWP